MSIIDHHYQIHVINFAKRDSIEMSNNGQLISINIYYINIKKCIYIYIYRVILIVYR